MLLGVWVCDAVPVIVADTVTEGVPVWLAVDVSVPVPVCERDCVPLGESVCDGLGVGERVSLLDAVLVAEAVLDWLGVGVPVEL